MRYKQYKIVKFMIKKRLVSYQTCIIRFFRKIIRNQKICVNEIDLLYIEKR